MHKVWHALGEHTARQSRQTWDPQRQLDYATQSGFTRPGDGLHRRHRRRPPHPTLMNETSNEANTSSSPQSAFADASYLEYAAFLYGDACLRGTPLTRTRVPEYITDAQQRLQHDQQFPNEPKQLRPGEDIQSSKTASKSPANRVMAINERSLAGEVERKSGVRFALEESFPSKAPMRTRRRSVQ